MASFMDLTSMGVWPLLRLGLGVGFDLEVVWVFRTVCPASRKVEEPASMGGPDVSIAAEIEAGVVK